jgi:hypothetical protein
MAILSREKDETIHNLKAWEVEKQLFHLFAGSSAN